jgi:HlyD family secretion protein
MSRGIARTWLPAAALALLAAGGLALCSHREPPLERSLAAVHREAFDVRVETVGALDAERAFNVVDPLRGDRGKIVSIIEDGKRVEQGDLIVRFDPTPFEADIQRLTGELRAREAMVEYARQSLEVEKSQVHKTLDNGEFDLKSARQDAERYQAYIDDLQALARKGYDVAGEIAQAKRKEEQLGNLVDKGDMELGRLQREAVYKVAQAAAALAKAESEAATSREALAAAREELARTEVRAPYAGFAVLAEVFQGSTKRRPRPGDTLWQGQAVAYLPDLGAMVVKTQVREEDLYKLRPGEPAIVRVDAYPDARFEGEVTNVGVLALESAGSGAAGKHFQVGVRLRSGDPRLRPGMTARVTILADRVDGALTVPVAALHYEGGEPVCFVFDGDALVRRKVRVGRRGDDLVEILAGLSDGERVSLARP